MGIIGEGLKEGFISRDNDIYYHGWYKSLELATAAMIESNLESNVIQNLLVKYWDLRPSEAEYLINENPEKKN